MGDVRLLRAIEEEHTLKQRPLRPVSFRICALAPGWDADALREGALRLPRSDACNRLPQRRRCPGGPFPLSQFARETGP